MMGSLLTVLHLLASVLLLLAETRELPIRRNNVTSTWQSSFSDGSTCFNDRKLYDAAADRGDRSGSFRFFQSAGESQADDGSHWFAVRLNASVLIRSVTVKGRADGAANVYSRTVGIEIWTSDNSSEIFSGDHCSSKNISRQFRESQQHWRLCGVTESNKSEIAASDLRTFTVNCIAEVRQLLLRKNVTQRLPSDFMSFADLRLQTIQLEPSRPQLVRENFTVEVHCYLVCPNAGVNLTSLDMQLCFPNSSCTAMQQYRIGRASAQESGKYTCRFGSFAKSTSVAVLSSTPRQIIAEHSSFNVTCLIHCGDDAEASCSELERWKNSLMLCLPNGSCIQESRLLVRSAHVNQSGVYRCRFSNDFDHLSSPVAILSSTPDQFVAENSSFTVSCSIHCRGADVSEQLGRLQLCTPQNGCSNNRSIEISQAQPRDSGNYSCMLDSLEKKTSVEVLYPPSKLSIEITNSDGGCNNSIVAFKASPSRPESEHRCNASGVGSMGIARLLHENGVSSVESGPDMYRVSRWRIEFDDKQKLDWNGSVAVECSAVQTLPQGAGFTIETKTARQQLICHRSFKPDAESIDTTQGSSASDEPFHKLMAFAITGVAAAALVASVIAVVLTKLLRSRRRSTVSKHRNHGPLQLTTMTGSLQNDIKPLELDEPPSPSSQRVESCEYLLVRPRMPADSGPTDSRSDCTEYIEIVADGH